MARNINPYVGSSYSKENTHEYDELISGTMSLRRWLDIRGCMKLCQHYTKKTRGDKGYCPEAKYRLLWEAYVLT